SGSSTPRSRAAIHDWTSSSMVGRLIASLREPETGFPRACVRVESHGNPAFRGPPSPTRREGHKLLPRRKPPMPRLTIVTFNVRYGTAHDGENHWERRWPVFGEAVRGLAADVLCLQECLAFQLDHVHHVWPGSHSVGVGRDNGLRS